MTEQWTVTYLAKYHQSDWMQFSLSGAHEALKYYMGHVLEDPSLQVADVKFYQNGKLKGHWPLNHLVPEESK